MRPVSGIVALASLVGASVYVGPGPAWSRPESPPAKSPRGGLIATSGQHQFEVFFFPTGVRVYPQGPAGEPIDVSRVTATATFYHPNSPQPWFSRPLRPAVAGPRQASESLDLAIDLSTVPATGARVAFEVAGLPSPADPAARFTVPFGFVKTPAESVGGRAATAEVHGYAPITSEARYFPLAGFYSTPTGVVWVPAPGYYHVVAPSRYDQPGVYRPPADWERAHPAPSPIPPVPRYVRPDLSGIHTDFFWHPKTMDDQASHEAWIRGQLRQKYGPGRGP